MTREAALETPSSGRHEKREADNGQDSMKNQKKKKRHWYATAAEARDTQRDCRMATRMRSRQRRW